MRIACINSTHPAVPHISGVRVPTFARALARRGHDVLLLTPVAGRGGAPTPFAGLDRRLDPREAGGWVHLETPVRRSRIVDIVRSPKVPAPLRRACIAWGFVRHGGVAFDWTRGADPFLPYVAHRWRPDVVWSSLGQSDAIDVTRRLASMAGCGWVMDVKDPWNVVIPAGLRRFMAWRFRSAREITMNARLELADLEPHFPQPKHLVYSGVADEMIEAEPECPGAPQRIITVTGGVYSRDLLVAFLRDLARWTASLPPDDRGRIRLVYAGGSHELFRSAVATADPGCSTEVRAYLPLRELAALCAAAFANTYIWHRGGFHHKLLELLAVGRKVVAYPGEHDEGRALADDMAADLSICADAASLASALGQAWRSFEPVPRRNPDRVARYSWDRQASELEKVLLSVSSSGRNPDVPVS